MSAFYTFNPKQNASNYNCNFSFICFCCIQKEEKNIKEKNHYAPLNKMLKIYMSLFI